MTQAYLPGVTNKVAMVVGATGAIGTATVQIFARAGAKVVLVARDVEKGERAAAELRAAGSEALFQCGDVTDAAAMDRAVTAAVVQFGELNLAFNNAGWEGSGVAAADITEGDWQRMVDIKLTGTWRALKAQVRQMQAQGGGGAIVNMAGSWGLTGAPRFASYCAAAHGVVGLTRSAAMDYAPFGIRINTVCPGAVDTPMLSRMVDGKEAVRDAVAQSIPMGRLAQPADVASAVLWLCSDASSYATGVNLPLTGGL